MGSCLVLVGSWVSRKTKSARVDEEGNVEEEVDNEGDGEYSASCGTHKKGERGGGRLPP